MNRIIVTLFLSAHFRQFLSLSKLFSTAALASAAASVSIDEVAEWQQPRPCFRVLGNCLSQKYLNKFLKPWKATGKP